MSPLESLLDECRRAGLVLFTEGTEVRWRGPRPSPDLLVRLRGHREALRRHLADAAVCLPDDQRPWLHVARQVLAGELDGGTGSLRESLIIGLRSIPHPLCHRALNALDTPKSRRRANP